MLEKVEIGNCTLYHADCREVRHLLQGNLLLADPPYGMGYKSNHNTGTGRKWCRDENFEPIEGDDKPFDPSIWLEYPKVVLWGGNYYSDRLPQNNAWLVWDKREGGTSDQQADCEMAWSNLPGPPRLYHHLWRGICRKGEENISKGAEKLHPNQKPVALMLWVIEQAKGQPGDVIVDPYMGSASMGVAAHRAGLKYIGVEKTRKHFETACSRLAAETAQMQLAL